MARLLRSKALLGLLAVVALAGCGSASDSGADAGTARDPITGPSTWTALYADYFSLDGAASCGNGGCHSSATDAGVVVSKFLCMGQAGCFASLGGASHLVLPDDVTDPSGAKLLKDIRRATGAGRMPKGSAFVFDEGDVARIEQWIANGANDD